MFLANNPTVSEINYSHSHLLVDSIHSLSSKTKKGKTRRFDRSLLNTYRSCANGVRNTSDERNGRGNRSKPRASFPRRSRTWPREAGIYRFTLHVARCTFSERETLKNKRFVSIVSHKEQRVVIDFRVISNTLPISTDFEERMFERRSINDIDRELASHESSRTTNTRIR